MDLACRSVCGPEVEEDKMMESLSNLVLGFQVTLMPINLLYCFLGAFIGTLIGVLPGIGPGATVAMLLPITFSLPPVAGLIMLAGIYYGAQYGGSTTSILINVPGEVSSVVTCLDGYQMARQGRAGTALAIAALGSFFAGSVSTLVIFLFSPPLAKWALKFGSPEYFSLMVVALVAAVVLAQGSVLKAVAMIFIGLLLGLVGVDVTSGINRFTFGIPHLYEGISFVVVAMGLFGFADIVGNLEQKEKREVFTSSVHQLMPTRTDLKAAWRAVMRGTALGTVLGILPGCGPGICSFASYTMEKRLSRDPSRFGKGAIEGVAGPESANNAAAQTHIVPLLTLGIPTGVVMAMMLGAMMIHGIHPGPQLMTKRPDLFFGVIASMWIGNLMLLVLNLPLIRIWVLMLRVPYRLFYPAIILFICIGAYSLNNNILDVAMSAVFGLLGYFFAKLGCEPAPLLLAFLLGPMMEENLRRSMLLSHGNPTIFLTRPISLVMLLAAGFLLLLIISTSMRSNRKTHIQEQGA